MKKIFQFVLAIILSFLPGSFGAAFSPSAGQNVALWYDVLNKSALTPDGSVFSIVWLILYILLGVALFLVIINKKATSKQKSLAYGLFFVHMLLNALWPYLFFGLGMVGVALIEIVFLFGFAFWMMRAFKVIDKNASLLIWPYLIWIVFATYLNFVIVYLN